MLSAASAELISGFVGGGAGNDSVVVVADTAIGSTIRGGDGNDSIWPSRRAIAGVVKTIVEADGTSTGVDTVRIDLGQGASSNTIDGGAGNDSIVLTGVW